MLQTIDKLPDPLVFTDSAASKVKQLITDEENEALMLRVFISGGGCSGFQYGFTFDESVSDDRDATDDDRPEYEWAGLTAVRTGVIVHRYLRQIAEKGLDAWSADAIDGLAARFELELAQLGVESTELETAAANVSAALKRIVADPTGRWILSPHRNAASELRLTRRGETRLEHLQLDRTFVDRETGIRWIIDYKTSIHEGGDIDAFLDSEELRYRRQLEIYASAMAEIDSGEMRVGLYFPLLGELRSWQPGLRVDDSAPKAN